MSETKVYTIKRGNHSSGFRISPFIGNVYDIQKRVIFSKCDYNFIDEDQQDWNKLFGINIGFKYKYIKGKGWISKSKIEFAWRYNYIANTIDIAWFAHINYEQHYGELRSIPLCSEFVFRILKEGDTYHFAIYDNKLTFLCTDYVHLDSTVPFGHYLFPYFGGNKVAQNDIVLLIKNIKEL